MTEIDKLKHRLYVASSVKNFKIHAGSLDMTAEDLAREINRFFEEMEIINE